MVEPGVAQVADCPSEEILPSAERINLAPVCGRPADLRRGSKR